MSQQWERGHRMFSAASKECERTPPSPSANAATTWTVKGSVNSIDKFVMD